MYGFLTALHLTICFALVISVLLQSGKGGGLAGAFGGAGGGQTIFGGRGAATFLSKATTVLGALFLVSALLLAMVPRGGHAPAKSLIQEQAQEAQAAQPTQTEQGGAPLEEMAPGTGELPQGETPATPPGTPAQGEQTPSKEAQPSQPGSQKGDSQKESGGGQ
jgi:preprotein translocase subunit SecG